MVSQKKNIIVEIIPDERSLAGFRARNKEQAIKDLPSYTLGRG